MIDRHIQIVFTNRKLIGRKTMAMTVKDGIKKAYMND